MIRTGNLMLRRCGLFGVLLCSLLSLTAVGCGEEEGGQAENTADTVVVPEAPVQGPNTGGTPAVDSTPAQPPAKDSVANKPAGGGDQKKISEEYIAARRRLVDILVRVHSENDLRTVTPMMTAAYADIAKVITKYQGKSSALKTAHTSPEVHALDQRLAAHLQQLAGENPAALRVLTETMQRQGATLAKLENKILRDAVDD